MHGKTYQSKTPKPIKSLKPIKIKQNPFVETTQKQHIPSTILHKNDKTMNNSHNEKKKLFKSEIPNLLGIIGTADLPQRLGPPLQRLGIKPRRRGPRVIIPNLRRSRRLRLSCRWRIRRLRLPRRRRRKWRKFERAISISHMGLGRQGSSGRSCKG